MISNTNVFRNYDSNFFYLRLPQRSMNELLKFYANSNGDKYRELLKDKLFMEGLYLASADLYAEATKYLNGEEKDPRRKRKLEWSILQYYTRSCYRCTPFGNFASGSIGYTGSGNSTMLLGAKGRTFHRKVRLDMGFLYHTTDFIIRENSLKAKLNYLWNPTLYKIGQHYRYVEMTYSGQAKSHSLAEIEWSDILEELLRYRSGTFNYQHITNQVVNMGFDEEESAAFVDQLIDSQILISDLLPNVTGNDYLSELVRYLKEIGAPFSLLANLEETASFLAGFKENADIGYYQRLNELLDKYFPSNYRGDKFQVDLRRDLHTCRISNEDIDAIREATEVLLKLTPQGRNTKLNSFKNAFKEKYEEQSIPLLLALDPDFGIDYKHHTPSQSKQVENGGSWTSKLKFAKYKEALRNGTLSVEIQPQEIEKQHTYDVSDSFYVMLSSFAKDAACHYHLKGGGGPSAANLLSRFCHMDAKLEEQVLHLAQKEQGNDDTAILAEISHLPRPRSGNVLSRPSLRAYEIPFVSKSLLEEPYRIDITDLYLKLADNRFVLYSKRLNREIKPRSTSAHNFSTDTSLAVYNFLCDLQFEGIQRDIFWNWEYLAQEEFLPRIVYKKTVLSPAIWNLKYSSIPGNLNKKVNFETFHNYLHQLQHTHHLPNRLEYLQGDNKLLLDLQDEAALNYLFMQLEKHRNIVLTESLWSLFGSSVEDEGMHYNNEIILPFVKRKEEIIRTNVRNITYHKKEAPLQRTFPPGSEWLYLKIYASQAFADQLIMHELLPLTNKLLKKSLIKKWFFLRYNDPAPHIRLRFHLKSKAQMGEALSICYKWYNNNFIDGKLSNIIIDTYKREIERYGSETMLLSEELFHLSSQSVAEALSESKKIMKLNDNDKIVCGLLVLDQFLNAFNFGLEERISYTEKLVTFFSNDLQVQNNKSVKEALEESYGLNKDVLVFLSKNINGFQPKKQLHEAVLILNNAFPPQSRLIKKMLRILGDGAENGDLKVRLLTSHFHMFVNRLFAESQKKFEFKIYYVANRHYKSVFFRQKNALKEYGTGINQQANSN